MNMLSIALPEVLKKNWPDVLIAVVLGVATCLSSCICASMIDPSGFWQVHSMDVWFDADTARVFWDMTSITAIHSRISVHPLFCLITFPQVFLLSEFLGLSPILAVRVVIAATAFVFTCTFYSLLRSIGCKRVDSSLFSAMTITSGAGVFGLAVPETYVFGSVGIVMALLLVAFAQQRRVSDLWFVAVSALTLSATTSNWMVGIFATAVHRKWMQTLSITGCALCVVLVLWGVEKLAFPSTDFIIPTDAEARFFVAPTPDHIKQCLRAFVFYSMIVPKIKSVRNGYYPDFTSLTVMYTSQRENSPAGLAATACWAALLGLGVWSITNSKVQSRLRIMLILSAVSQLLLHMAYGPETFLYSMHYMPLLVVLAAFSTLTPKTRLPALMLAVCLIISAGLNNAQRISQAAAIINGSALVSKRPP